jgi:uncharacterized membrane protein
MPWIYPAIVALLTLSVGMLLERILMKNDSSEPVAYATLFQFLLGFTSLIFALVLHKFELPDDWSLWPRFLAAALLWAGSSVFSFQAMKRLGAGEVTILGTFGTIITIFLSAVLLHEAITLSIYLGAGLILFATLLVVTDTVSFGSRAGVLYAVLSALCAAFAVTNDVVILQSYEAFSYTAVMSFLPGIVLFLMYPKRIFQNKQLFKPKTFSLLAFFGIIYSIQAIAYYLALESGAHLSQLSPLIKTSTVLTVIMAAVFLKERRHLAKKGVAAALATIGAILVG